MIEMMADRYLSLLAGPLRRSLLIFNVLGVCLAPGLLLAADSSTGTVRYRKVLEISESMRLPTDVALDAEGRMYVLDGTANMVRVFDGLGTPLFTLGGEGTLDQPLGIDVSDAGEVLVADSGNHRVAIFPPEERVPGYIDLPPLTEGKEADPTDLHYSPDYKTIITVDNDNHRMMAVDREGELIWSHGGMGRNPGEFRFPFMVDMDHDGNIYVVEVINTRVQVLNPDGTFKQFIGEWGIEPGQFFRPKGIAVSDQGEVFVSDSYLGVVQIFDQIGNFLGVVADEDGKLFKFTTPMGMAASEDRLLVVEMYTNRLLVMERQR
ncbi:MAG: DNA-binding beta-propeller fold protein YncE [Desulforhopalus sp.]